MINMMTSISIWTVYNGPDDFPNNFVARRFEVTAGEVKLTDQVIVCDDLGKLREHLKHHHGDLHSVPVFAGDDSKVIEVWA
jgi:hypothetical protein